MRFGIVLLALLSAIACGDPPPPADGQIEGAKLAKAMVTHLDRTLQMSAPFRCARIQLDRATPRLANMDLSMERATLIIGSLSDKKKIKIAALSDARGNQEETLKAVALMRETFIKEEVDIVLSLGGLASKKAAIHSLLSALSTDAPYLTLAIPGDRESTPAHRAAVADLAKSGTKILDGAQYRLLRMGNVLLATMPGVSMEANLIAAKEGCLHTADDGSELLRYLDDEEVKLVVASYAPIRGGGSDLGAGGIHVGETQLAPLLQHKALAVHVHGMVSQKSSAKKGKERLARGPSFLAAGSVDPLDGPSSALIFSISDKKLLWQRIVAKP